MERCSYWTLGSLKEIGKVVLIQQQRIFVSSFFVLFDVIIRLHSWAGLDGLLDQIWSAGHQLILTDTKDKKKKIVINQSQYGGQHFSDKTAVLNRITWKCKFELWAGCTVCGQVCGIKNSTEGIRVASAIRVLICASRCTF